MRQRNNCIKLACAANKILNWKLLMSS